MNWFGARLLAWSAAGDGRSQRLALRRGKVDGIAHFADQSIAHAAQPDVAAVRTDMERSRRNMARLAEPLDESSSKLNQLGLDGPRRLPREGAYAGPLV
ncbi:hypothetical protein [Burkholderia vietnamiensis]|uniref:hypothetical protein n=1 Tax=Burkholderia vietnamiensis TaxID=60552 RepID=UPI0012D9ADB6|nr:hypothetical protein [Burkholderia vietnamiensis]